MTTTETRCENCGCAMAANASACPACGHAHFVATSVGAVGARDYAVAPMPLGPYDVELGVSESISATFRMWAENLPRTALLAFVPYIFMLPLIGFSIAAMVAPSALASVGPGGADAVDLSFSHSWAFAVPIGIALSALWLVATLASSAGIVHVVDERARGVVVSPWHALLTGLRHVVPVFGAWVFASLLAFVAIAAPVAPIVAGVADNKPILALFAIPGVVVTAAVVVLLARLAPLLPAIVVEDKGLFGGVSRALELTRGKTGVVVAATLLFGLAWMGASMIAAVVGVVPILGALAQIVVNALLTPLVYIFPFAVYAGAVRAQQLAQR